MSDGRNRLRSVLDTALTVGAISTSLLAIAVVVVLLWWMRSLSSTAPEEAVVPVPPPARQQAARAPRDIPAPPPQAPAAAQRVAAAAQAPAPTAALPTRGANDDAAKNRALGAALSRLADDPELQRKLLGNATPLPR